MGGGFATLTEVDGVRMTSAEVNGFVLSEFCFSANYVQQEFEPELPYLAVVLEGALEKSFRLRTMSLSQGSAVTMPVGAIHGARFGSVGARVVIARARSGSNAASCLHRLAEVREPRVGWLAWRIAAELRTADTAAPLAAEGLALELLAEASRSGGVRALRRPPAWLRSAEELLRARIGECIRLGELADEVGVHPAHLARVFRAHYGVSVGEYGRRVRLAWAATEIARSDAPLAWIASQAGFADQSHFTRLFRAYSGMTPARYRSAMLRAFQGP